MRILHVSPYSDASFGGPVSTLTGLAIAQKRAGARVSVVTMLHAASHHSVLPQLEAAGVDVISAGVARGPLSNSRGIRGLTGMTSEYDVIHLHGVWEQLIAHMVRDAARAGVPSLLRPCGMLTTWSMSRHAIRKRILWSLRTRSALQLATAIHFASEQERRESEALPVGAQSVFVEPNGIDVASFNGGNAQRFRTQLGITSSAPIILFVARMHPGKGLEKLIRAFAGLSGGSSGASSGASATAILVIAGPADSEAYASGLRSIAQSAGVSDRVRFTGMIGATTRRDALAAASMFALPSDHESFGNSALEALAAGVPCLLTDRVPLARHVSTFECGVVCTTDEQDIARGLRVLFTAACADDSHMSERARECAQQFDWAAVAARIEGHYAALVSPPRVRHAARS